MPRAESQEQRIALPPDLDMLCAEALKGQLRDLLDGDEAIALDGSAVARVSSACVQVIYAAAQSAKEQGRALALHAPSEVLTEAFIDLGLESDFREWSSGDA